MNDKLLHFLVRYDKENGTTTVREFEDEHEAFTEYLIAEREPAVRNPKSATVDVVLIGAESLDVVKATYPHYFASGTRRERLRRTVDQLVGGLA